MKSIITVLVIAIITKSQCQFQDKSRFSNLIYKIEKIELDDEVAVQMFQKLDKNCVKNFIKIPQNDELFINEYEEIIFKASALFKCSDENLTFKYYLSQHTSPEIQKWTHCFAWQLKRLEPETFLIKNLSISERDIDECKTLLAVEQVQKQKEKYEEVLGPLDVFSCGAVTGIDDYLKFVSKGVILKYGNIAEELKRTEMEKLKNWFKDVTVKTAGCMINRYERDIKAHNTNQTLNSFFEEFIKPVPLEEESEYFEITKILDNINFTCTKEQLNLPENGNLPLLKVETYILIGSAMSKCIKIDNYDFMKLLLNFGIDDHERDESYIYCSKSNLKLLESESKLVKNFIDSYGDEKNCEFWPAAHLAPFEDIYATYKDSVGGDVKDTSCGVMSDDLVNLFSYKALLIQIEEDEELKKSESLKLFNAVKDKIQQFADCVLHRVK